MISAYRADWPERASSLITPLAAQLGPTAERIEHIGSTSIPGMAAKDVIDLQISAADLDRAAAAFGPVLTMLGFEAAPIGHDHVPAGLNDDPELWRKRFWSRRGDPDGDVNLHVRETGSPGEGLALLFRDWFRAHPEAIPAYAAFKRSLAEVCPDTDVYSDVKDPVVDLVVTVAQEWAAEIGWQVGFRLFSPVGAGPSAEHARGC